MTMPIATSPGRAGFDTQLALTRDSEGMQRAVRLRLTRVTASHHAQ